METDLRGGKRTVTPDNPDFGFFYLACMFSLLWSFGSENYFVFVISRCGPRYDSSSRSFWNGRSARCQLRSWSRPSRTMFEMYSGIGKRGDLGIGR